MRIKAVTAGETAHFLAGVLMRAVLLFLLGLLIGACTQGAVVQAPAAYVDHTESASDLESKTVALVTRDLEGNEHAYCSGVWVSDSRILTAHHCIDGGPASATVDYVVRFDVYAPGDLHERTIIQARSATVQVTDEAHDLALLHALGDVPSHRVARVALDTIRAGSFAQAMGHSFGLWWSYSSGDIASVRQADLDLDIVWIQATVPISPGNSGGGLFDASGNLVGLTSRTFGSVRAQHLNFFVHGQYIDALLRRVPS
jgi:S1-C subfamily serine protease